MWGRDPLELLLMKEGITCKGCAHSQVVFDALVCTKGKRYGRRCKWYEERIYRKEHNEETQ